MFSFKKRIDVNVEILWKASADQEKEYEKEVKACEALLMSWFPKNLSIAIKKTEWNQAFDTLGKSDKLDIILNTRTVLHTNVWIKEGFFTTADQSKKDFVKSGIEAAIAQKEDPKGNVAMFQKEVKMAKERLEKKAMEEANEYSVHAKKERIEAEEKKRAENKIKLEEIKKRQEKAEEEEAKKKAAEAKAAKEKAKGKAKSKAKAKAKAKAPATPAEAPVATEEDKGAKPAAEGADAVSNASTSASQGNEAAPTPAVSTPAEATTPAETTPRDQPETSPADSESATTAAPGGGANGQADGDKLADSSAVEEKDAAPVEAEANAGDGKENHEAQQGAQTENQEVQQEAKTEVQEELVAKPVEEGTLTKLSSAPSPPMSFFGFDLTCCRSPSTAHDAITQDRPVLVGADEVSCA